MSKLAEKRVRFTDANDNPAAKISRPNAPEKFKLNNNQEKTPGSHPGARFKEDHSIDSDSEGEEEGKQKKQEYEKLTEEDVEGAEDNVYEGDGEKLTPFNLREEMEEGDFDRDGNYHFKKDREIRDNWLDNIDWVDVKKASKSQSKQMDVDEQEDAPYDEFKVLSEIVELMKPAETVTKAIRRLGNNNKGNNRKNNKRRPWEKQKVYDLNAQDKAETSANGPSEVEAKNKADLLRLTELVDRVAGSGHYDIYTDTYEKIKFKVNSLQTAMDAAKAAIPEDEDDALDMFASNIDKDETGHDKDANHENKNSEEDDDAVKWFYKWKADDTETFGPFTSQQMQDWKDEGFFKEDVFVRREDRENETFYSSKRIDFELYI